MVWAPRLTLYFALFGARLVPPLGIEGKLTAEVLHICDSGDRNV